MGRVLIVPYGIEMNEKAGWISADFVLIVPYGIEMEMAEGLAVRVTEYKLYLMELKFNHHIDLLNRFIRY